jgi:hypothetical protein
MKSMLVGGRLTLGLQLAQRARSVAADIEFDDQWL